MHAWGCTLQDADSGWQLANYAKVRTSGDESLSVLSQGRRTSARWSEHMLTQTWFCFWPSFVWLNRYDVSRRGIRCGAYDKDPEKCVLACNYGMRCTVREDGHCRLPRPSPQPPSPPHPPPPPPHPPPPPLRLHPECGRTLYNGHAAYRLGDMLTSVYFRHSGGGIFYHQRYFPNSFATRFAFKYNGRPLGRGKTPVQAVAHMVQLRRNLSRYPPPPELQQRAIAAVHLRVGDVLEFDPQGVSSLLCHGGGRQVEWKVSGGQFRPTPRRPRLYAQPAAYFDFVAREPVETLVVS